MKSLCSSDTAQTQELERLLGLVTSGILSGTDAWALFSSPKGREVKGTDAKTYKINTPQGIKALEALKLSLRSTLYQRCAGACVYCRRPVAHYGYGWQIEHVKAKQWYGEKAFALDNLVVACIECNAWKGHLDKKFKRNPLPIVNPLQSGFEYTTHLRFVSVTTERLAVARYKHLTPEGTATYEKLKFEEIERAVVVDSVNVNAATLHARMDQLIDRALSVPEASELVDLLANLKSKLYAKQAMPNA